MAGQEDWMAVATGDEDDIRERILTGYKDGKPFTPYVPTLRLPAPIDRVLDFGCGLGHNFPFLRRAARTVAGFDLPPMIERCRTAASEPIDLLTSDWHCLKAMSFDLIVASLVLQHVEPSPVREFLDDFARMAPAVYLLTRIRTDFDENILDIVAQTGRYDADECVEVDHDPVTHQLRVLGRMPFDEARTGGGDRHYELLLKSRR
jgi:SAM-dependent methyltransferase